MFFVACLNVDDDHGGDDEDYPRPMRHSSVVVCGHCLVTSSLTINEKLKCLSSLPISMQESLWWWQCNDRYMFSLFTHLHNPFPPFSPSLIALWFLWTLSIMFILTPSWGPFPDCWSSRSLYSRCKHLNETFKKKKKKKSSMLRTQKSIILTIILNQNDL